jgi:hypothetical protein
VTVGDPCHHQPAHGAPGWRPHNLAKGPDAKSPNADITRGADNILAQGRGEVPGVAHPLTDVNAASRSIRYLTIMAKNKTVAKQKTMGRPVTVGGDEFVGLRLPSELLEIIDTYAAANGLKRSEAIRALIDEGIIANFPHTKIAEVLSDAKAVPRHNSHRRRL